MKFIDKLKKTYAYYKSLGEKDDTPPRKQDIKMRADYFAFLTAPYPVTKNEKEAQRKR